MISYVHFGRESKAICFPYFATQLQTVAVVGTTETLVSV